MEEEFSGMSAYFQNEIVEKATEQNKEEMYNIGPKIIFNRQI